MLNKSRYIPANAIEVKHENFNNAVVYLYELAGKPMAIGYQGKRTKKDFHYSYHHNQQRQEHIDTG